MNRKHLSACFLFLLALCAPYAVTVASPQGVAPTPPLRVGNQVPSFAFPDVNGRQVSSDDLKGEYAYICIGNTRDASYAEDMAALEKLSEEMAGHGIVFVSITVDMNVNIMGWRKNILEKQSPVLYIFAGDNREFCRTYHITDASMSIILDKEGRIVAPYTMRPSSPHITTMLENLVYDKYNPDAMTGKLTRKDLTGTPFPDFCFTDVDGNVVTQEILKGHYTLVDLWATWCGPCRAQIPHIKALEEKMHGRNIRFIGISVDDNADAWRTMVIEKEMGGTQLIYGGDRTIPKHFASGYPCFILVDREGLIIDANMQVRPSDSEMFEILNALEGM